MSRPYAVLHKMDPYGTKLMDVSMYPGIPREDNPYAIDGGMYGNRWMMTADIFGSSQPRYPSSNYGSLYKANTHAPGFPIQPDEPPLFGGNASVPRKENFAPPAATAPLVEETPISPPQGTVEPITPVPTKTKVKLNNPALIFLFLMAAVGVSDFFTQGLEGFFSAKFNGGQPMGWKMYMVYALVGTIILFALAYFSGVSLLSIEEL